MPLPSVADVPSSCSLAQLGLSLGGHGALDLVPALPHLSAAALQVLALAGVALLVRLRFGSWGWGLTIGLWALAATRLALHLQAWWLHGQAASGDWWLWLGLCGLGWGVAAGAAGSRHGGPGLPRILISAACFTVGMLVVIGLTLLGQGGAARQVAVGLLVPLPVLLVAVLVLRRVFRRLVGGAGSRPACGWTMLNSLTGYGVFAAGCLQAPVIGLTAVLLGRSRRHWLRNATRVWMRVVYAATPTVRWRFGGELTALAGQRLVVANHESMLDILSAGGLPGVRNLLAKTWVFKAPFLGIGARAVGIHNVDTLSIDAYLEHPDRLLGDREGLFVFPEGRRSRDGLLGRFHLGAFHLAAAAGSQVVPVAQCASRWSLPPSAMWIHPGELSSLVLAPVVRAPEEPVRALSERVKGLLAAAALEGRRALVEKPFNVLGRRGWFLGLGPAERRAAAREDQAVRAALVAAISPGRWLALGAGEGAALLIVRLLAPQVELQVVEPRPRLRRRLLGLGLPAERLGSDLVSIPGGVYDGVVCLWRDPALVGAGAARYPQARTVVLATGLEEAWCCQQPGVGWERMAYGAYTVLRRGVAGGQEAAVGAGAAGAPAADPAAAPADHLTGVNGPEQV